MIDTSKVQRYKGVWEAGCFPITHPRHSDGPFVLELDYDALAAENAEMKKLLWEARQSEVVTRTMRAVWGLKYTQEIDALLGGEK